MRATPTIAFASVLLGTVAAFSLPANAACKKFGFTVNDYGKDGPTNDAKNLLDKHITEWAAKNGVTDYSTGKKTVSCELFLDVILFDEHTCTASATVCWGPDAKKLGSQSAAAPAEAAPSGAPPAPVRKAEALGHATQQAAAPASADAAAADVSTDAPATDTAAVEAAPTTPVEQIAAPAEMPAAAPAVHTEPASIPAPSQTVTAPVTPPATTGAVVETGTLQAGQDFAPQAQRPASSAAAHPPIDAGRAAAAAAAASAAAAAERAAQAAETAANAAKEAAAAAVAASAASKRGATVPPLNHASGSQPAAHAE